MPHNETINQTEELNTDISEDNKKRFITDEKYLLLKQCQQAIYEATEVSPTLRKLVNEIITMENLEKIKMKIINNNLCS